MEAIRENREAVIALQGGGVYGLTLLGQLSAVLNRGYVPLAFAGTSAGAIVATLAWAGYHPDEIYEKFLSLGAPDPAKVAAAAASPTGPAAKRPTADVQTLLDLLLPTASSAEISADQVAKIWGDISSLGDQLDGPAPGFFKRIGKLRQASALWKQLSPHVKEKGFFRGDKLEKFLDELIKQRVGHPGPGPVKFRDVAEAMSKGKADAYRPPLVLTATNLTKRRLELISSIDARYMDVPVARAARASAGYPVFFTPRDLPECPDGGWFVDGGVVANFPIWAFSEAFRARIEDSYLASVYRFIAIRPWIRIGLRVVDDLDASRDLDKPSEFFGSLGSMLTGGSRNELEEILASNTPRGVVVKQPYGTTNGPANILDVKALTKDRITSMFTRGREYADTKFVQLGSPAVLSAATSPSEVTALLENMVKQCAAVVPSVPTANFRANIFMPVVTESGKHVMRLMYQWNMDSDPDRDMEFPDLKSGLTGFCYWSKRPQICNLQEIARFRTAHPEQANRLFGMPTTLQAKVRTDRTWLASVPIFDPHEVRVRRRKTGQQPQSLHRHTSRFALETELDGPILGVLNVDAGWDYGAIRLNSEPSSHCSDPRIQAILSSMQAASFKVASMLSEEV